MDFVEGADAIASVVWEFEDYSRAQTPITQAGALIRLQNAMSDLATWHPAYDLDTGTIKRDE